MYYLQVKDLNVQYQLQEQTVVALQGVNLHVGPGEIVGILGKTGSGKTTLLRSILGLLPEKAVVGKTSSILLGSTDTRSLSAKKFRQIRRDQIRIISQNPYLSLNPTRRCGQQMQDMMQGSRRDKQKEIRLKLKQVGIVDPDRIARSYPHQLSLGQCQRVGVAMALTGDPKMILADEPTSALNRVVIDLVVNQLKVQAKDGAAVLLITHDLALMEELATRWCYLEKGRIATTGTGSIRSYTGEASAIQQLISDLEALEKSIPPRSETGQIVMKLRDVSFLYQDGWGRRGAEVSLASLHVRTGSCLGISGPSGCGKSTILKLLGGLEQDYRGSITYQGTELRDLLRINIRQFHCEVQYLFQDAAAALPPRMKVRELLLRTLKNNGAFNDEVVDMLEKILAQCNLERTILDQKRSQLSGGQQQRVALARALCVRPKVILFDESLASLDLPVQLDLLDTIRGLVVEGNLAAVLVSHRKDLLQSVCSEIIEMN